MYVEEIYILSHRYVKGIIRDKFRLLAFAIQIIILTVLLGLVFLQIGLSQQDIQNRIGILFFIIINVAFTILSPLLNEVPLEKPIIRKEREARTFRVSALFIAKAVTSLPLLLIGNIIYITALYWMIGLKPLASAYGSFVVFVIGLVLFSHSFGLFVGSVSSSVQIAQIVGPTLLIVFVIFGGNFANAATVPSFLSWFLWLSPVRYAYQALIQTEFADLEFTCDSLTQSQCIQNGNDVITSLALTAPDEWVCFLILLGFSILFYLLGYIGIRLTTS